MIAPLALLGFALLVGSVGARWLDHAGWTRRAPGLGILVWQVQGTATFLSLVLASLALAVPELPVSASEGVAGFLHSCSLLLKEHYATPAGSTLAIAGVVVTAVLLLGFALTMADGLRVASRSRRRQRDLISMVRSEESLGTDVAVIDHETPAVFCLPGRRGQVVVTRAALAALTEEELRQVLAHERAHLRSRHHWAVLWAETYARVLRNRLGTGSALAAVRNLIEMHADDAGDPARRRDLASAVVVLAGGAHPVGALAASGGCARARVERLAVPAAPLSSASRFGLLLMASLVMALPPLLASLPAAAAVLVDYCPVIS